MGGKWADDLAGLICDGWYDLEREAGELAQQMQDPEVATAHVLAHVAADIQESIAGQAFDIMERLCIFPVPVAKGWSVWVNSPDGTSMAPLIKVARVRPGTMPFPPQPDPFTALVVAAEWYEANKEE